jgi:ATP-dependent RNA helicase RhlE
MKFSSLGLPTPVVQAARAVGYNEPTPIQHKAIPVILQGNDLIGNAPSGSGKTGAFLMPALARLLDGPQKLRMLVLTPTREHAAQVETAARDLSRFTELRVSIAHNAAPIAAQERVLRDPGCDVLIATVDRVLELHARKAIAFEDVEILVLDEADRMVDMGQAGDVRRLLKLLPETRQTLLFSATMPAELNRLAKEALIEPVRVDLALPQPTTGITHAIYPVPRHLKIELLDRLLNRTGKVLGTIVFTRQREGADRLARQLERRKHGVVTLHDQPGQTDRERILEDLKRERVQIVVATDLAARGIDLAGVAHVVNFDVPPTPEDYVQRIGRAGRPDATGDAFTLMAPEEQRHLAAIERYVGRAIPRVLLPDFDYGLKPSQLQQQAVYDDEKLRARRAAALAKMPYAAARSAASALARSNALRAGAGRSGSSRSGAARSATTSRPKAPAAAPARPRPAHKPLVEAKLKPVSANRVKPLPKPIAKPVARPIAKPVARSVVKPIAKPVPPKPAPRPANVRPSPRPKK